MSTYAVNVVKICLAFANTFSGMPIFVQCYAQLFQKCQFLLS